MKTINHNLGVRGINIQFLRSNKRASRILWVLLTGLTMVSVGSCSLRSQNPETTMAQIQKTTEPKNSILPPPILSSGDPNFVVGVVQKVGSAVVRIDSSRIVTTQVPGQYADPFYRRFFGDRAPSAPQQRVERGSGSGFIINCSGQILTNSHVVDGTDTVTVTLKDGRTFKGKVLGEDPVTDVAVIKIDANNLPTISLGNSDILQPGEAVIAIGNPLGLNNTVTSGILSAIDRSRSDIGASDKRVDYLQTDAAINPGNSGGPLMNSRGEVIGMNTAIIRGAQGLGFAIPINTAQKIAQELITKGKVEHPYLGVQMITLTPEVREKINQQFNGSVNIAAKQGVLLVRIVRDSPAATAGLRPGDVIKSINNQPVAKIEEVQKLVENSKIGSPLQVQVERNGQDTQVKIIPVPLPVRSQG